MEPKLNCILLIDDDEATNFVNTILIESEKCTKTIKSVTGGLAGLVYLNSSDSEGNHPQPDLIFLDINMPGMNGWEFMEEYNRLPKNKRGNFLIWLLSTSNNPDDKIKAKELGSDGFMAKPLTKAKLKNVIEEHFG
ncbi:MAG: response regulator [Flavobacteriales bacterium]